MHANKGLVSMADAERFWACDPLRLGTARPWHLLQTVELIVAY